MQESIKKASPVLARMSVGVLCLSGLMILFLEERNHQILVFAVWLSLTMVSGVLLFGEEEEERLYARAGSSRDEGTELFTSSFQQAVPSALAEQGNRSLAALTGRRAPKLQDLQNSLHSLPGHRRSSFVRQAGLLARLGLRATGQLAHGRLEGVEGLRLVRIHRLSRLRSVSTASAMPRASSRPVADCAS